MSDPDDLFLELIDLIARRDKLNDQISKVRDELAGVMAEKDLKRALQRGEDNIIREFGPHVED